MRIHYYGLFPLPDSDSDTDSCTLQDFSIGSDSDPLIEMFVIGMEIYPWDRDPFLKWVQYPFRKGIWIRVWVSGNMFCTILCSHRVWNPSLNPNLNPSLAVEISHYAVLGISIKAQGEPQILPPSLLDKMKRQTSSYPTVQQPCGCWLLKFLIGSFVSISNTLFRLSGDSNETIKHVST